MGSQHLQCGQVFPQPAAHLHYVRDISGWWFSDQICCSFTTLLELLIASCLVAFYCMTSSFDICMYPCTVYYTGARSTENIQDLIRHFRDVHDDTRRPLPLWCGLPQQPPRCWCCPVHTRSALYPRTGCEFPSLSSVLCAGQLFVGFKGGMEA